MGKISEFYKTILLIVLSIVLFLGFKKILPDRLFAESLSSDPSMLIDSVLLDLLDGGELIEASRVDISLIDHTINDSIGEPAEEYVISIDKTHAEDKLLANHEKESTLKIKPFKRSNFSQKLEKRRPHLFIPKEGAYYIGERPIVDTLLDPTISVQGYGYLQRFYSKLKGLEDGNSGKVRVAYFGDSMNDGDLIVQDFRSLLQDTFGGNGVGFVSISSLSSASRGSVYHKHSDWNIQSFITSKKPTTPFGVDGQVFLGSNGNWVSYTAGGAKNSPALYNPRLLYGHSDNTNGFINATINKGTKEKFSLSPLNALNVLSLGGGSAKTVTLNFGNIQSIPIYGLDFSSNTGVHVDNFSLRGNSGLTLVGLNTGLMNAFDRQLHYDLIVLHYGTNVLNYGSNDYSFYERGMKAVINKLRMCFPNADILVISTADKASKINAKMQTDPAVVSLIKAQKNFSRETGCGYIDLFNLMGGDGAMVDWVNRKLANTDYTHFNVRGSKEVGGLLYEELERGYKRYKTQLERDIKRSDR